MESLAPLIRRSEIVSVVHDGILIGSMAVYESNLRLLNTRIAALAPLLNNNIHHPSSNGEGRPPPSSKVYSEEGEGPRPS